MSDSAGPVAWTAFVLAGGLGTRLRSIVSERPKVLAPILGRPMLAFLLQQLVSAGIRRVVLGTGHLGDQVEAEFGASFGHAEIVYSRESMPLGTGGSLRLAAPLLGNTSILVLNGDSYCDTDLKTLVSRHSARGAMATIALTNVDDAGRYGAVMTDVEGRITAFQEKRGGAGRGQINAGIYALEPGVIARLPATVPLSLERDVFPALVGHGLFGWPAGDRFIDIGTPESYGTAGIFFQSLRVVPTAPSG